MNSGFNDQIQGIEIHSLLQMIQMEGTTCTLRVQTADEVGFLYVLNGELIDAETGDLKQIDAAKRIVNWTEPTIKIEYACEKKEKVIRQPLMNILAEAVHFKGERKEKPSPPKLEPTEPTKKSVAIKAKRPVESRLKAPVTDSPPLKEPSEPARKFAGKEASRTLKSRFQSVAPKKSADTPRKKRLLAIFAIALGVAVILMVGVFFGLPMIQSKRAEKQFNTVMLSIEGPIELEEKINILKRYADTSQNSAYATSAWSKIKEIQNLIEEREFQAVQGRVAALAIDKKYEDALALYRHHLKTFPKSIYQAEIKQKVAELSQLADDADYNHLMSLSKKNNPERIEIYFQYVREHPEGRHRGEVETLISDMNQEYYRFLKREIDNCKTKERWEQCIQLCDKYVAFYASGRRSDEVRKLRTVFDRKFQEQIIFEKLVHNAKLQGDDYQSAKKIYSGYLHAYPGSPLKSKIEKEIDNINEQIKQARIQNARQEIEALLQKSDKRFTVNGNDTVTDKETGLIWCMFDSLSELGKCIDYMTGIQYVKNLRTGGFQDWRLPTVAELQAIYKRTPFYPARTAKWYWTSQSYSRFSDGWSKVVDIVTTKQETVLEKNQLDSRNCGAVHAVRP